MRFLQRIFIFLLLLVPAACTFSQQTTVYNPPDADYKLAIELFQKQKYGSAQKQFEALIPVIKDRNSLVRTDAEYYAAVCAMELFNKDAEVLLKNFIANHPESPKVRQVNFQLGKLYFRSKKWEDAIHWFEKVESFDLSNEEMSEYYFKTGYSYFELKNMEKAKKNFYEIRDIDTKYTPAANYYYSHICYTEKNYETALTGFLRLSRSENFGPIVPYYIAQIYYLQGRYDEVIAYAPPLLDSASTKRAPEIARIIGESYYRTARYKEAVPFLEKYKSKAASFNRQDFYELGYAYYKSGNCDNAVENFKSSIAADDSLSQNAYYHLGDCYLKKNDKQLARSSFQSAYKIGLDKQIREDALYSYARLSLELSYNPFNDAIKAFETYIAEYPASPRIDEAYNYLVTVYVSSSNYKAALASIEKIKTLSYELKSVYQKIAYNRGVQLFSDNDFDGAIAHFSKAQRFMLDKKFNTLSWYWKGETYYRKAEKSKNTEALDSALACYKQFMSTPGALSRKEYDLVNYNIGYAYFQLKNYADANLAFRKFVNAKPKDTKEKLNDAFLRIGDCYYVSKDYSSSIENYNEALKLKVRDGDYALFQKAMCYGYLSKSNEKINALQELLKDYPGKSTYEDDAKFELASEYLKVRETDRAYTYYKKLVDEHPASSYVSKSLLQLGVLQYNKKKYGEAVASFNKVINKYPKTSEALEAIESLKDLYVSIKQPEKLDSLKKAVPYANISSASVDSSTYQNAEDYLGEKDYTNASKYFTKYIQLYPDGIFITDAYYNKAECDFRNNNLADALGGYQYVIDKGQGKFLEASLVRASGINFRQKNYQQALTLYAKLDQSAENPKNTLEARLGAMRCNFLLKNYQQAIDAANKVIGTEKVNEDMVAEAHLTIARSAYEMIDYTRAMSEFQAVVNTTKSERSAEARYNIALILYNQANYADAKKAAYELINQEPAYDLWIGKAFILVADVYYATGDKFNAKVTLKSYIENSTLPELIQQAKERLDKITAEEKTEEEQKQRKKAEEMKIEFKPEDIKDNELYKDKKPGEN